MFVADEVVTPVPPVGSNCYVLSGFALSRPTTSKPALQAASLALRKGGDVEIIDIQVALTAEGSPLLLYLRTEIFFFSQLVAEPIGMFIGRGLIQTPSMRVPCLHYFSCNAGRKVLYDRGGEITLLEPEELTKEGSKALFFKKIGVEGKGNLDWIDLREVHQVLCPCEALYNAGGGSARWLWDCGCRCGSASHTGASSWGDRAPLITPPMPAPPQQLAFGAFGPIGCAVELRRV